jgi:hypothetical protein
MYFRALDFWQQLTVSAVSCLLVGLAIYGISNWLSKRRVREANMEISLLGSSSSATADIHHDWESWQQPNVQ